MSTAADSGSLSGPMAAWANRMRSTFEDIGRKHRGEAGRRREDDFREFLRAFLPNRLGVATGEIVATDGGVSPQMDVIVYDAMGTPLLDRSESSVRIPVEGVYAVIEVASKLTSPKLRGDVEKIRKVKRMPKTAFYRKSTSTVAHHISCYGRTYVDFPIMGFCFAYESSEMWRLGKTLFDVDDTSDLSNNLDMICTLDRGCIANGVRVDRDGKPEWHEWSSRLDPDTERFPFHVDPHGPYRGHGLMLFYVLGLGELALARMRPVTLRGYIDSTEE